MRLIKKYFPQFLFVLSFSTLFFGFFLDEDGTGRGASGDFKVTFDFIIALQSNLLTDPKDFTLVHTPLHYYLMAAIYFFIKNETFIRIIFIIASCLLPILFYKTLLLNNSKRVKDNLFILSSIIFILPAFRYTVIWPTDLVTSLIFFQLAIIYYLQWSNNKTNFLDKNIFFNVFFLALATYCRQYFCIFFIFFLYEFYKKIEFYEFVKLFFICILTSIPVLAYTYLFPELITEQHIGLRFINYFLLGNASMISVYIIPLILFNLYEKNIKISKLNLIISLLTLVLIIIIYFGFNYREDWLGGGVIYAFSRKILDNDLIFLFSVFTTYFFLVLICIENKKYIPLFVALILVFFSFQVYQRYYEPMFFLIIFSLVKSKYISFIFNEKKYCLILFLYYLIYYLGCTLDIVYKI